MTSWVTSVKVKKVNFSYEFWDDDVEFKIRNYKTGKESQSFLIDSTQFLFSL